MVSTGGRFDHINTDYSSPSNTHPKGLKEIQYIFVTYFEVGMPSAALSRLQLDLVALVQHSNLIVVTMDSVIALAWSSAMKVSSIWDVRPWEEQKNNIQTN